MISYLRAMRIIMLLVMIMASSLFCCAESIICNYVDITNRPLLTEALDDIIDNSNGDSADVYFSVSYNDMYYDISPSLNETELRVKSFKQNCLNNLLINNIMEKPIYSVYRNYYIFIDTKTLEKLGMKYSEGISHSLSCSTEIDSTCEYKTWSYIYKNDKLYKKMYNAEIVPLPGENFIRFYPMSVTSADVYTRYYKRDEVTALPLFPGGNGEKSKWLSLKDKSDTQTKMPADIIIPLKVIILKSGYLQLTEEAEVFIKNNAEFGSKIYERLKLTPQWIPGKINGEPVDVLYYLNFIF